MQKQQKTPELCIPCVSVDISKEFIFNIFCNLKIGYIQRITEIPLKSNALFKRVIIKVKWNPSSDKAKMMFERIIQKLPVFIVYSMPWYWKVVLNQMPTEIFPPPAYSASTV